jgi:hypothetical protein
MKLPVFALLSIVLCGQACSDSQHQEGTFLGLWYFFDENEKVITQDFLEITKGKSAFLVVYKTTSDVFKGELNFSQDGRSLEGTLKGFGKVIISTTRSLSEFSNGALSMDQVNEIENIPIGFFQKKEVLEKLLKKKLP